MIEPDGILLMAGDHSLNWVEDWQRLAVVLPDDRYYPITPVGLKDLKLAQARSRSLVWGIPAISAISDDGRTIHLFPPASSDLSLKVIDEGNTQCRK